MARILSWFCRRPRRLLDLTQQQRGMFYAFAQPIWSSRRKLG